MTGQNKDIINEEEKAAARLCLEHALACGASEVRVSLGKSTLDTFMMYNGELDKVTRCADRSVFIYIFADGRYGTYSTNRLAVEDLLRFVEHAIESTRMLAPDACRHLPAPERLAKDAVTGMEAGLYDESYMEMTAERRRSIAESGAKFASLSAEAESRGITLISEECEYSDSVEDGYVIDSKGFEGRHTETSFSFWSEITISDSNGSIYTGYWWESSPRFAEIDMTNCSKNALDKAEKQIAPQKANGGKMKMVVDNCSSSRLISPILSALNASAVQQKKSFLESAVGMRKFPETFTLKDLPREYGKPGARMFDTEGVATENHFIIEKGIVKEYFVNTYMADKTGMAPTVEGVSRPVVEAFPEGISLNPEQNEINLQAIMKFCGDGIYVTGFNGGNCNPVTGNFSYGVEGFVFRNGRIIHPVKEMIITGNMLGLWNSLITAGNDARSGARWQIPTLAFDNVDFSA